MSNKYPMLRPNEIITALTKRGFVYKSQRGSHVRFGDGHHTAIIPKHDTVARGTLKSILIQAGIELEDFMKLL
jgi:predicted RNA binding protein YcfA (HicA-like mRNA interferase family)